jgi:hypothetical protein
MNHVTSIESLIKRVPPCPHESDLLEHPHPLSLSYLLGMVAACFIAACLLVIPFFALALVQQIKNSLKASGR